MLAPLSPSTNTFSPKEEEERNRDQNGRNAGKYSSPPVDSNIFVHWNNKQWKRARHHRSQESIGSNGTGTVAGKCVDQVSQSRLEDGCEPKSYQKYTYDRWPIVNVWRGCPYEDDLAKSPSTSCMEGLACLQAKIKSPAVKTIPPIIIGGRRASGTGRRLLAWNFLK